MLTSFTINGSLYTGTRRFPQGSKGQGTRKPLSEILSPLPTGAPSAPTPRAAQCIPRVLQRLMVLMSGILNLLSLSGLPGERILAFWVVC